MSCDLGNDTVDHVFTIDANFVLNSNANIIKNITSRSLSYFQVMIDGVMVERAYAPNYATVTSFDEQVKYISLFSASVDILKDPSQKVKTSLTTVPPVKRGCDNFARFSFLLLEQFACVSCPYVELKSCLLLCVSAKGTSVNLERFEVKPPHFFCVFYPFAFTPLQVA